MEVRLVRYFAETGLFLVTVCLVPVVAKLEIPGRQSLRLEKILQYAIHSPEVETTLIL
jgi:hypothetical protein